MCVIHRHGMGTEYTTSGCGRRPYHGKCADFQTSWFLFCGQNLAGTQTRCGIGIPKTSQVRIWCSDTFDLDWSPCAVLIRLLFRVPGTSSLSINASKHKRTRIGRAETASSNHCSKMTDDSTVLKSGRSEPRKQHINELQYKALARPLMMEAKYGIMA